MWAALLSNVKRWSATPLATELRGELERRLGDADYLNPTFDWCIQPISMGSHYSSCILIGWMGSISMFAPPGGASVLSQSLYQDLIN